jgi:hypothetical protein
MASNMIVARILRVSIESLAWSGQIISICIKKQLQEN